MLCGNFRRIVSSLWIARQLKNKTSSVSRIESMAISSIARPISSAPSNSLLRNSARHFSSGRPKEICCEKVMSRSNYSILDILWRWRYIITIFLWIQGDSPFWSYDTACHLRAKQFLSLSLALPFSLIRSQMTPETGSQTLIKLFLRSFCAFRAHDQLRQSRTWQMRVLQSGGGTHSCREQRSIIVDWIAM